MIILSKQLTKFSLILIFSLLVGCNSKNQEQASARPNIILISLDTLRADRLGLYGYERNTSPNLDKFSKEAAIFENASSVTSWTLPAHVSMLSGLYPSSHKVTQKKGNKISEKTKLLAEILKENKYRTFGFANGGYVSSHYGFKRGFEEYPRSGPKGIKNDDQEVRALHKEKGGTGVGLYRAKEKISELNNKEPFFIFVHTYDIHCPFHPPEPYYSKFITNSRTDIDSSKCVQYEESENLTREQVWTLSDRYDGNIAWADNTLGEFFDWFDQTEASKNTYVIITSDHGEEFFEHGFVDHANSLYKELVHVPLIVRGPGIQSRHFKETVSLVDIVPTVLELLGINWQGESDGASYASLLKSGKSKNKLPEWRLAELDRGKVLRSAYDDKSNMILDKDEKTFETVKKEYYSHTDDPFEKNNTFNLENENIKKRFNELNKRIESFSSVPAEPKKDENTQTEEDKPENLEELKSLGYF